MKRKNVSVTQHRKNDISIWFVLLFMLAISFISFFVGLLFLPFLIPPLILWPFGIFMIIFASQIKSEPMIWYSCNGCGTRLSDPNSNICPCCKNYLD